MEVASPTAGSVLVEVSQLQLLQACHEVTVRTMSPHGESTDSIPAPVAPALAPACQPARMSCLSPRPSPEARTALASVSPGLGDPSFPLRHPAPHGTQDSPASLPMETCKGSQEEPPVSCGQVLYLFGGRQAQAEGRAGIWAHSQCHPSQEESGATVPGTSEEKRASEPALGQEGPGPMAPSLAKQQVEWTSGETGPMPSSTQGEPTQKAQSTEACHGGDLGSGLKPRTEVGVGDALCRIKMSLYTWSAPFPCFCSGLVPMPLRCVCFSVTFFFFCHPFDSLPQLPQLPLCFLAMFSSSVKGSFLIPVGVDPAKSSSCFSVFPLLF